MLSNLERVVFQPFTADCGPYCVKDSFLRDGIWSRMTHGYDAQIHWDNLSNGDPEPTVTAWPHLTTSDQQEILHIVTKNIA